jgi:hypothetical protein
MMSAERRALKKFHGSEQRIDVDIKRSGKPSQRFQGHIDFAGLDLLPMAPMDTTPFGRGFQGKPHLLTPTPHLPAKQASQADRRRRSGPAHRSGFLNS